MTPLSISQAEAEDGTTQDRATCNLHDLPPELLEQIMFFLPPSSILHLMVNRTLRPICEGYLYRAIMIVDQQYRSLHLLKTFALRPDLALLVQHLGISLQWCAPGPIDGYRLPAFLQPDGLTALSWAKNVRSLSIGAIPWLSDLASSRIREVVSNMDLTSLTTNEYYFATPNVKDEQKVMSNLVAILQAQPHLEFLTLSKNPHIDADLMDRIRALDLPSLKRFRGEARFVGSFLSAASRLEHLDIYFENGELSSSTMRESWNGHKIRHLRLSFRWSDIRDWNHLGSTLGRFPNVESLCVASTGIGQKHPSSNFRVIASQLHAVPFLRKLEIHRSGAGFNSRQLGDEMLLEFKKRCPALERVVDPAQREWVYVPSMNDGGSFQPRQSCRLVRRSLLYKSDLPSLVWDV